MFYIINMFCVVVFFWLIIEVINYRICKNKKPVNIVEEVNHEQ